MEVGKWAVERVTGVKAERRRVVFQKAKAPVVVDGPAARTACKSATTANPQPQKRIDPVFPRLDHPTSIGDERLAKQKYSMPLRRHNQGATNNSLAIRLITLFFLFVCMELGAHRIVSSSLPTSTKLKCAPSLLSSSHLPRVLVSASQSINLFYRISPSDHQMKYKKERGQTELCGAARHAPEAPSPSRAAAALHRTHTLPKCKTHQQNMNPSLSTSPLPSPPCQ